MRFPAKALTPSQPRVRGIYNFDLTLGFRFDDDTAALLIMRHSPGFMWPIRADNDRDAIRW